MPEVMGILGDGSVFVVPHRSEKVVVIVAVQKDSGPLIRITRYVLITEDEELAAKLYMEHSGLQILSERERAEVVEGLVLANDIWSTGADELAQGFDVDDSSVARQIDHDLIYLHEACIKLGGPKLGEEVPNDLSGLEGQ